MISGSALELYSVGVTHSQWNWLDYSPPSLDGLNVSYVEPVVGSTDRSHKLRERHGEEDGVKCEEERFYFLDMLVCFTLLHLLIVTFPPFLLMASIYPERVKTVKAGIQNIQILTSKTGFCNYTTVLRARFERLFSTPICPC